MAGRRRRKRGGKNSQSLKQRGRSEDELCAIGRYRLSGRANKNTNLTHAGKQEGNNAGGGRCATYRYFLSLKRTLNAVRLDWARTADLLLDPDFIGQRERLSDRGRPGNWLLSSALTKRRWEWANSKITAKGRNSLLDVPDSVNRKRRMVKGVPQRQTPQ